MAKNAVKASFETPTLVRCICICPRKDNLDQVSTKYALTSLATKWGLHQLLSINETMRWGGVGESPMLYCFYVTRSEAAMEKGLQATECWEGFNPTLHFMIKAELYIQTLYSQIE